MCCTRELQLRASQQFYVVYGNCTSCDLIWLMAHVVQSHAADILVANACVSLLFDFMIACFIIILIDIDIVILPALMSLGTNSISDGCLSQFVAEVHLS